LEHTIQARQNRIVKARNLARGGFSLPDYIKIRRYKEMELYKNLNFIKAQNKCKESKRKNQEIIKRDYAEIQAKQSIKNLNKFIVAVNAIENI